MNHFDSRTRRKLVWLGAMLAPVVGVQAVRLLSSTEVSAASAAAAPQDIAPPIAAEKPLTA